MHHHQMEIVAEGLLPTGTPIGTLHHHHHNFVYPYLRHPEDQKKH
jgi:hypothetical protein